MKTRPANPSSRTTAGAAPRVLHVLATGQRRGAEMSASDLIRSLNALGVEQRVVILRGSRPVAVSFEADVALLHVSDTRMPVLRVDRGSVRSLRAVLNADPPDLVHAHGNEAFKTALLASGVRRGPPILYRRIGIASPLITRGPRRLVHGSLMRRSHRIVAVAEAVRRETIDTFRVPRDRVLTLPRAVDPGRVAPVRGRRALRAELGIDPAASVILSMGSLSVEKDPLAHLAVTQAVARSVPGVIHLFAGDGPMRGEVEHGVHERGLQDHVKLLGVRDDVGDVLAASDVMILASLVEGMPGVLIEAAMAGVPSVARDVAGVGEVVEHEVTGFVIAPHEMATMPERVAFLLTDEKARAAMGAAARERCLARFSVDVIAPRYLALYEEMLA